MTILYAIIGSLFWVTLIELANQNWKDRVQMDFDKMKRQLVKLLNKDGFQNEMKESRIVITYRQKCFVIHFDESQFGKRYARVTIADYYIVDGMDEVHPFVMDAVMGRATHTSTRTPNIAYDDTCLCYYATDVRNIKDFYRGMKSILDMLINNENYARRDFAQFRRDFGRKKEASEDKHIGFKTASSDVQQHSVAAEADSDINA